MCCDRIFPRVVTVIEDLKQFLSSLILHRSFFAYVTGSWFHLWFFIFLCQRQHFHFLQLMISVKCSIEALPLQKLCLIFFYMFDQMNSVWIKNNHTPYVCLFLMTWWYLMIFLFIFNDIVESLSQACIFSRENSLSA